MANTTTTLLPVSIGARLRSLKQERADLLAKSEAFLASIGPGATLTEEQLRYAASDVEHLHALRRRLDEMLARERRSELAAACFAFLPIRAQLDLAGFAEAEIFEH